MRFLHPHLALTLAAVGACTTPAEPDLGSAAEELTQTATFQSGVNGAVDDTFVSATEMRDAPRAPIRELPAN